jgi:hypothetical protein
MLTPVGQVAAACRPAEPVLDRGSRLQLAGLDQEFTGEAESVLILEPHPIFTLPGSCRMDSDDAYRRLDTSSRCSPSRLLLTFTVFAGMIGLQSRPIPAHRLLNPARCEPIRLGCHDQDTSASAAERTADQCALLGIGFPVMAAEMVGWCRERRQLPQYLIAAARANSGVSATASAVVGLVTRSAAITGHQHERWSSSGDGIGVSDGLALVLGQSLTCRILSVSTRRRCLLRDLPAAHPLAVRSVSPAAHQSPSRPPGPIRPAPGRQAPPCRRSARRSGRRWSARR